MTKSGKRTKAEYFKKKLKEIFCQFEKKAYLCTAFGRKGHRKAVRTDSAKASGRMGEWLKPAVC